MGFIKKIRSLKLRTLIKEAKHSKKARFWLRVFIAYHIVKGTATTALIWVPLLYMN